MARPTALPLAPLAEERAYEARAGCEPAPRRWHFGQ